MPAFLIDALIEQGIIDFFVAPGSRNSPLIIAAARHPKARLHRHFDERGLGFYALGTALAAGRPSAVIVTSGTAAGNLLPAIMEAYHSSIPLLILTADRPPELRSCGANQTTNQVGMFSNFVRFAFDLDPNMPLNATLSKLAEGVFYSKFPQPGPVHINCPLKEPLYPVRDGPSKPPIQLHLPKRSAPISLHLPPKGVIMIGKLADPQEVKAALKIGHTLQWPVFADILSEARLHPTFEQIDYYDTLDIKPDCILHLGDRLTLKKMESFQANQLIHVSPYPDWIDPYFFVTDRIVANPSDLLCLNTKDPDWLKSVKEQDEAIKTTIQMKLNHAPHTESALFAALSHAPLEHHAIFLGNSMPIREANWFLRPTKAKRIFANRGLSGIDGNIATIAGIAEEMPTLAVIGDLTALHDLNSLALLKTTRYPITLIISNNDGGGIFSHLAASQDPASSRFLEFTHGLTFEKGAEMFDILYVKPSSMSELLSAINLQTCIIEWTTSRPANHAFHLSLKDGIKYLPCHIGKKSVG